MGKTFRFDPSKGYSEKNKANDRRQKRLRTIVSKHKVVEKESQDEDTTTRHKKLG